MIMRKVLWIPYIIVALTGAGCTLDLGALRVTSSSIDAGVADAISVIGTGDARSDRQTVPAGSDGAADTRFVPDLVTELDSTGRIDGGYQLPDVQNDTTATLIDALKDITPASVDTLVCKTLGANSTTAQFGTVSEYCFKVCFDANSWQCSGYGFQNGTRVVTVNGQKVDCVSPLGKSGTGGTLPAKINGAYTFYISGIGGEFDEIDFPQSHTCF
jgi:hypothetical protein